MMSAKPNNGKFHVITIMDAYGCIADSNGNLPGRGSVELAACKQYVKSVVENCTVIMGHNSYKINGPIDNCKNIVITRQVNTAVYNNGIDVINDNLMFANDLTSALKFAENDKIYVIGGATLYGLALMHENCERIIMAQIGLYTDSSMPFPQHLTRDFMAIKETPFVDNSYIVEYVKASEEARYLDALRLIMKGAPRGNATNVKTLQIFPAPMMSFTLSEKNSVGGYNLILPLMTTKYMDFKDSYYELIMFLRGDKDNKYLLDNNVHSWDNLTSRVQLDVIGHSDKPVGWIGNAYSNWRDFNGIDQILNVIENIKRNPYDKKHIVTAWNPNNIITGDSCIPPTHIFFQFNVRGSDEYPNIPKFVDCLVYMRSINGLTLPYVISSYSLLTHLIARICGFIASKVTFISGDTFIPMNKVDKVNNMLSKTPKKFPNININNINSFEDILRGDINDIEVINY